MSDPILHPTTQAKLTTIALNPPHALLISGPSGIGKSTISDWLAAKILDTTDEAFKTYPHILRIQPEQGKAIGIEAVRQLEHFVSLRIATDKHINRFVIITDAHALTVEAQNALLKTLEEPPRGTVLLLTSSSKEALLPTILSRLQVIDVIIPPKDALQDGLEHISVDKRKQVMALSGGLPGLAFALANDEKDHSLVIAAQTARELLQTTSFERMCRVDSLAKDRDATASVLFILMQMAHAALLTGRGVDRWQKVLATAYDAQERINNGTQPKLALTNLMLNL